MYVDIKARNKNQHRGYLKQCKKLISGFDWEVKKYRHISFCMKTERCS